MIKMRKERKSVISGIRFACDKVIRILLPYHISPYHLSRFLMLVLFTLPLHHFTTLPLLAAEPSAPSDTELLEKQRNLEKDLERRVQNILDKVFGPNQSEVKASVNLSIIKKVEKGSQAGQQAKRKEENPLGETKFILPGVPAPKNVAKEKEPENVEKQQAEREQAQTRVSFKVDITNREVLAFYNEKLKSKESEARKAVMAMTDLKETELKFIPGKFFDSLSTFWNELIRDPKNLLFAILIFLALLLLLWLFVPLTGFFKAYVRAMKEKAGIEVKMESTGEQEGLGKEGMTPEELAAQGLSAGEKEGDEEMKKKYVPFDYINDENIKRLLGVFRKEPPQVIALVLSYLKPELVRQVYAELPQEIQTKVAAESGALRQATEEQVRMVDQNIKDKIDFLVGGIENLIRILDEVDYKIRDNILEYLMNHRPQLYEKVRSNILMFEDVLKFPDLAVQTLIRELKTDQLARALKNVSPEIMNKFMSNMSQGGAALLKEEMEFGRPVTEDQIEQERQVIMDTVKKLESEGKVQVREKKKVSIFESEDATSPLLPSLPDEGKTTFPEPALPSAPFVQSAEQPFAASTSAETAPESGASLQPEEISSYLSYGQQLYSEGKYEEAMPYLQAVVQSDATNAAAYQAMGHCYYGLGMTTEALQCYDYALSLAPEDETLRQWVEQLKQSVGV